MTSDKFNQIITNRASERVNARIAVFERKVAEAFREIGIPPNYYNRWTGGNDGAAAKRVMRHLLGIAAKDGVPSGYPQKLWDEEREAVAKELLETLDEMAKALIAPPATPIPIAVPVGEDAAGV